MAQSQLPQTTNLRDVRNWVSWRLMLIPVAGALLSVPFALAYPRLKVWMDIPGPYMLAAVALVYGVRFLAQREALFLLLAALATAMALREGRDAPGMKFMTQGIYVAAALIFAWGVVWRKRLLPALLRDRRHTLWLTATFFGYFLSVLAARRVFRFVPGEQDMHCSVEESAEVVAHLMFIATCLLASSRKKADSSTPDCAETAAQTRKGREDE